MSDMIAAPHRWASRATAALGLFLVTLVALLLPAGPASAHAVLVSSSPPAEVVLSSAPAEVVLTFSESVREVPDKIRVLGPDGSRVDQGTPSFEGNTVAIPVDQTGPQGTYLVSYRVISADGHPVAGGFTYSVGARSVAPVDTGADDSNPVVANAVKVAKFAGYLGLVLMVGPVLVLGLLWPRRLSRRVPARLVWIGTGLVGAATVAGFWLQVPYTTGGGPFEVDGSQLRDVLGSMFGAVHLVRLGILAAAAILLAGVLREPDADADADTGVAPATRTDHLLLAALGVAGLATWPLAGHPAASPVPAVSVVIDTVHLAGMAVWLGGLTMLAGFLLRRADERELGAILPVWSRWAAAAVCALLLAGTTQALIEVGTLGALFSTPYGRLIMAKVGLFAVVLAVAAYSRQLVRRRTAAGRPGRMRQLVIAELAVTVVVLAVSSVLVQTTPARTVAADTAAGVAYFNTTLTSPVYALRVVVDPARTGNNSVHLDVFTPDNQQPLPVVEWRATAALPAAGVEPIEVPLLPLTDNHATGEINLPTAGEWEFRFVVRTSEIDQATVTATVPIG
nr:copper resistance protein CopC [Micromonospora sp. DSM 115978]